MIRKLWLGAWLLCGLGLAGIGGATADETGSGNVPTPGLTQAQVDALIRSVHARCKGDLTCYQRQESDQFNRLSNAYDNASRVSDGSVRQGLHHFCTDPATQSTPFYEVAPCLLIYHRSLLDATIAAAMELPLLAETGSLSPWFEHLKIDQAENPRTTTAMRVLAVALHDNCPGDAPERKCALAYLAKLGRDERYAVGQAQIAQDASSRLTQTGGACLQHLNQDESCRKRQALLPSTGERWDHAITELTTQAHSARIAYESQPAVPTQAKPHSFFSGSSDAAGVAGADALVKCIRRKNSGVDIQASLTGEDVCKSTQGTPLAAFGVEVSRIEAHLSSQSYFELVRLIGVARLLDAHRRFIGTPLTALPLSCRGKIEDGFHEITGSPQSSAVETPAQRKATAAILRDAAKQVVELLAAQADAKYDILRTLGDKSKERCNYFLHNKNEPTRCSSDQYADTTRLIQRYFDDYPLLSAGRDPAKEEYLDPGETFAFASASDSQLDEVLTQARSKLGHSMSEAIGQLCSAGEKDGLDWRDLARLPINDDPLWSSRFPEFDPLRQCLPEVLRDEKNQRAHAVTALKVSCFFADLPTVGLASAACQAGMALKQLDESAHSLTWLGRCRAAGNAFCDDTNLTRARTSFEQANIELAQAEQQAGLSVAMIGTGLGALHLSGVFSAASAGEFDALASKLRPIRSDLLDGSIKSQAELDARLEQATLASEQGTASRVTPVLTRETSQEVTHTLGLSDGQVGITPFKSGAVNDVYDLVPKNGETHFGTGPEVPAGLRGKPIARYKVKLTYSEAWDATNAERDERTLGVLKEHLGDDPQYEGVHIAETHFVGYTQDGRRIMVQETVEGEGFMPILKSKFDPVIGHAGLDEKALRGLYTNLYQQDTIEGIRHEVLFTPDFFREHFRSLNTFNKDLGLEPLQHLSDADIANLKKTWESPDMMRLRELTARLKTLDAEPAMKAANAALQAEDRGLTSTPIWGSSPTGLNGDFANRNMLFWRGPDGRYNLTLCDF